MKLLLLSLLFAACTADIVDRLVNLLLEEEIAGVRQHFKENDKTTWYFPNDKRNNNFGTDLNGQTKPSRNWSGAKAERELSHFNFDADEDEIASAGEPAFFIENNFSAAPVFVKFDCDKTYVKTETTEVTAKITGSYKGAEGSLEGSYKNEREFEHKFVQRTGFTKVGAGMFLEEGVADTCTMIYATVFAKTTTGTIIPIMNTSGVQRGKVVKISGTPDNARIDKSFEACAGTGCGCWNDSCWTECALGWCYSTHPGWGTQSGAYVTCESNRQCKPGNRCAGPCTP